jgi:hypothetical protein
MPEFGCSGPHSRLTARRATEIEMKRNTTRSRTMAREAPKGESLRRQKGHENAVSTPYTSLV